MTLWKSLLLHLYYHGSYPVRWWRNLAAAAEHRLPVVILFYHRIADDRANSWTLSNRSFARQVDWLARHFDLVSLEEGQRRIRAGDNSRPCASITFDDGYRDNCLQAIPLLIKREIPCTYFVTVGNVLSGEPFAHDVAAGNRLPPNRIAELRAMAAAGIEIGAHTYSHANLGQISSRSELHREIVTAGEELQQGLGSPVRYFAFPFGQRENLSSPAFELAHEAGYEAVCSAYGGYNFPGDDAFHLQRIPADQQMIRLKNRATIDPRKDHEPRFVYGTAACQLPEETQGPTTRARG